MTLSRTRAAALLVVAALGFNVAACADNCRPGRGWDRGDHRWDRNGDHRWDRHHCDRDRDRHRRY